ncbi:hypothetical protein Tco_0774460 [Tanacetum coccineum]|uniref:Uncharacterized protein n=1 Tax=Tanacetum coccineum TaxID=301880 RepID=A0ABQ4ZNP6_9ASTR
MRMEQYLTNTDYALWQVIMNGDEPVQTTKDENGVETEVPPKTAQALLQRQRERKAKSTLLLAIPDEYQLRFHGIKDAKTLWAAIKSRFGGNVESKKMQKTILKQQFENFSVSDTKGLDKAYDRNKTGIDDLDIDDLYNNLKVFEADIKSSSGSYSNSQNVAFLSAEDTNNINEVNTTNGVSTALGHNSQGQASSSSYTDDLMFSFFANQSNSPQLDDEDLKQIDHDDLEEIDLKWQVLTKPRLSVLTVIEGAILPGNEEQQEIKGTRMEMQGIGAGTTPEGVYHYIAQDEPTEFALMAYTSGSDTEKNEAVYDEKIAVLEFEVKDKDSRSSDGDDNQINDMFKKDNEYHAVPPPLTGNYMPPLADLSFAGLDDSVYRPTTNKTSASVSQVKTSITPPSNTSVEMLNLLGLVELSLKIGLGNPQQALKYKGMFDSGCSRHMTGNKALLTDYQDIDGDLTKAFDVTRFQFLIASIVLVIHHTANGHQFTMSSRQERIGYSRANDNCKRYMLLCKNLKPQRKSEERDDKHISLDEEFARSFYEEEQAQILQDEVYAKQVEAQWIANEERIPQEAKQTDEREKVINWNDPDVPSVKGDHTEIYQFFEDMLKNFDRDDLVKLWKLVKDIFSSTKPNNDKEKALWVELKRLFELDTDNLLELRRYMHDPLTWRLYAACGFHHVSTETGLDIFMLVDKDYTLTRGLPMLMLVNKLQAYQHSEIADEFIKKIYILANRPRQ